MVRTVLIKRTCLGYGVDTHRCFWRFFNKIKYFYCMILMFHNWFMNFLP